MVEETKRKTEREREGGQGEVRREKEEPREPVFFYRATSPMGSGFLSYDPIQP